MIETEERLQIVGLDGSFKPHILFDAEIQERAIVLNGTAYPISSLATLLKMWTERAAERGWKLTDPDGRAIVGHIEIDI